MKTYYHNNTPYAIGDTILTAPSPWGDVVVTFDLPRYPADVLWFVQGENDRDPVCIAALRDAPEGVREYADTARDALKALFVRLAEQDARKAAGIMPHTCNKIYEDWAQEEMIYLMIETAEDPRMMVRDVDGRRLTPKITADSPITLERCRELANTASSLLHQTVTRLRISHVIYAGERADVKEYTQDFLVEGDWSELITKTVDRVYHYNAEKNGLLVEDFGEYAYTNDDGTICDDAAAIADTLAQGWTVY